MTGVAITGVGMHPFGRFEGVSTTDMGVAAVRVALHEAGIGKGGFQAAFCGTAYGGVATGHKVLSRLGMTGMPIVDVEAGCASGGAALMLAAAAIRAGQYDTALVFGTEKMPKGIIRSSFFEPWQEEAGLAATPAFFGLRAQRLCLTSGVTKDHLARVVVKNRRHGVANPDAMYQKETTVEEVLGSRVVCEPLHLFMLCSPNEGAAALVLRRADLPAPSTASASALPTPVTLAAAVLRSHIAGPVLSESTPLAGLAVDAVPAPSTLAATAAYEEAGLGPSDLDVVECQDTDAARELLSCEELGLCEPGGSAALLDSGATALGGRLPVNPSGGLLSKGEPLGASALGQVVELVRQLRSAVRAAPGRGGPDRPLPHGRTRRQRRRRHPDPLAPRTSRRLPGRGQIRNFWLHFLPQCATIGCTLPDQEVGEMPDIRNRVGVNAPIEEVYEAIATRQGLAQWWTHDVEGDDEVGGRLDFRFGGPDRVAVMEVVEVDPAEPGGVARQRRGPGGMGGHDLHVRPAGRR